MTEEKKLLITRIERGETDDGKPVIELYEDNPRLKWPSLRLFDPSKLLTVGTDPNELQPGEERFVRFYAYYVESDRLNGQGNPYKDCTGLEAIAYDRQDDGLQDTLDAIVELLQNIEHHLANVRQATEVIAGEIVRQPERISGTETVLRSPPPQALERPVQPESQPKAEPPPWDESKTEPKEDPEPVLNEDQARRRFSQLAGPAVRDGTIDATIPSRLTSQIKARAVSWRDALAELEKAIVERE